MDILEAIRTRRSIRQYPMNRHYVILTSASMRSLGVGLTSHAAEVEKQSNPSIVYIPADNLGYGDVACYNNNSKIPTPHLDRLACEGIRMATFAD